MKPIVLAMILCDHYYRDVQTGKSILSGTFSTINTASFPAKHGNCAVYLAITDVSSNGKLQLVFRKENGDFRMEIPPWEVKQPGDRRAVVEIGGNISGLPLPEEGDYEFAVLWEGQEIFSRRLRAARMPMAGTQPPGTPSDPTSPGTTPPGT